MSEDWLTDDVVAAIADHMNRDHAEDNVVICQALGGVGDAVAARMVGMDHAGLDFEVTTPTGSVPARVEFSSPVTERPQIRAEVAHLHHLATGASPDASH